MKLSTNLWVVMLRGHFLELLGHRHSKPQPRRRPAKTPRKPRAISRPRNGQWIPLLVTDFEEAEF